MLGLRLGLTLNDIDGLIETLGDTEGLKLGDFDTLGDTDGLRLGDRLGLSETDGD